MNSKGEGKIDETYKTLESKKTLNNCGFTEQGEASPTPQAYLGFDSFELIVEILLQ